MRSQSQTRLNDLHFTSLHRKVGRIMLKVSNIRDTVGTALANQNSRLLSAPVSLQGDGSRILIKVHTHTFPIRGRTCVLTDPFCYRFDYRVEKTLWQFFLFLEGMLKIWELANSKSKFQFTDSRQKHRISTLSVSQTRTRCAVWKITVGLH